jgi:hypothetical protein
LARTDNLLTVNPYTYCSGNSTTGPTTLTPDDWKCIAVDGAQSVVVDASSSIFQQYTGGVITSTNCGTTTNQYLLAVGYSIGTSAGDYVIV